MRLGLNDKGIEQQGTLETDCGNAFYYAAASRRPDKFWHGPGP
jgi:hypothetical protein